jgi:glutathione S-transferase
MGLTTSLLSTLVRGTTGISAQVRQTQPAALLQLYDIENCPYCRLVREALTELSLDAEIYPCPKGGERYRSEVVARGGKAQFPYLIDPNTGVELYESLAIVEYLFEHYGDDKLPLKWRAGALQTLGSMLASAVRLSATGDAVASLSPQYLLELYSFESSPYARLVREQLCAMELPYVLRNCGRSQASEWLLPPVRRALEVTPASENSNRRQLQQEQGRVAIPYLYDPNTDTGLFESADILDYLQQTYAANA